MSLGFLYLFIFNLIKVSHIQLPLICLKKLYLLVKTKNMIYKTGLNNVSLAAIWMSFEKSPCKNNNFKSPVIHRFHQKRRWLHLIRQLNWCGMLIGQINYYFLNWSHILYKKKIKMRIRKFGDKTQISLLPSLSISPYSSLYGFPSSSVFLLSSLEFTILPLFFVVKITV